MDFIEKCRIAGIGDGSCYGEYPIHNGRVFKRVMGALKAFTRRADPKLWEDPLIEDTEFPQATLDQIEAIETDDLGSLPQAIQDAIAIEELDESVRDIVGSSKFVKITHWFLLKAMKYYYAQNPAYLADWHSAVDRLFPDTKPWD